MSFPTSVRPGDFVINSMSILGKPVTHGLISFSIYESIFLPTVVAEFNLQDSDDALIGGLDLSGGEPLSISFSVPGGQTISYDLLVNQPTNPEISSLMKSRTFKLVCASEEAFYAAGGVSMNGYIQRSWPMRPIHAIVGDVLTSYCNSKKNYVFDDTKGAQGIIAENEKVWPFIDRVRRLSVSTTFKSSSYVFFENRDGFHLVTIEGLFNGQIVKSLVSDPTVGTDLMKLADNNIIGYKLPDMFDAISRIDKGTLSSRSSYFDFETGEYVQKTIENPDDSLKTGGSGDWNAQSFQSKFGKFPGRSSVLPYDNRLPLTHVPETTPYQLAYAGNLMQNLVCLRVPGDTALKAGDLVDVKIPRPQAVSGNQSLDQDVSGTMLIASIRHMINQPGENPRYTCVLECLKGSPSR